MRKDFYLLWDLFFYFLIPIFCWEIGRQYLPDYMAMILSSFPGIFYSVLRLYQTGSLFFTRIYLLINIIAELSVDLLSGSALRLLWNTAFYSLGLCFVYFFSCIINKPLFLYFSLDILVQQGYDRKITREVFFGRTALKILKTLTYINGFRELTFAILLIRLIKKRGVEIYTFSILLDQLFSFLISGVSILVFFYLYKLLNEIIPIKKLKRRQTQWRIWGKWCYFYFERSFYFFSNHF